MPRTSLPGQGKSSGITSHFCELEHLPTAPPPSPFHIETKSKHRPETVRLEAGRVGKAWQGCACVISMILCCAVGLKRASTRLLISFNKHRQATGGHSAVDAHLSRG